MKYAIIKTGGKQYKVSEGDVIEVEQITAPSDSVTIDSVLLLADGDSVTIGSPLVKGASVKAKLISQVRGEKIRVATYKSKVRHRKVRGHRQHLSRIHIEAITHTSQGKTEKA